MRTAVVLVALAAVAPAGKIKEKEPDPKAGGKVYEWKAQDGLAYCYRVPKDYDPVKGANLLLVLHGSNLSRYWGFSNHDADRFRPDDLVVCPDGTTSNGRGGFNFLGEAKDVTRLRALVGELKAAFRIRDVYLYGHSQGSFFAFLYAGEHPDEVQGVLGHASGVWTWTKQGAPGHHQAIVLMHGTHDATVPYGNSVGGLQSYREAGYPLVRLWTIEGGSHVPAEHNYKTRHSSLQLAWIEGMASRDPARVGAAFELLCEVEAREYHDYAAIHAVARRLTELEGAPDALRKRAEKAMETVNEGARGHVAALDLPETLAFEKEPWVGHLPMFLRAFAGVPACEELKEKLAPQLKAQEEAALENLRTYWQSKDPVEGFTAGVQAVRDGFLYHSCADGDLLDRLAGWRKDRKLKLPREAVRDYDAVVPHFRKAWKEAYRSFEAANRKIGKP